ncbi:hypothetical protein Tco_1527376, partial [Tanacetum coccineum]
VATCHLLSGATWPASRHRNHHRTTGQRQRPTVVNDDQPWRTTSQPPPDHRSTTAGPLVNHRQTTSQWCQMVAIAATWHATSANWVPVAYVAATSVADVAEGMITFQLRFELGTS